MDQNKNDNDAVASEKLEDGAIDISSPGAEINGIGSEFDHCGVKSDDSGTKVSSLEQSTSRDSIEICGEKGSILSDVVDESDAVDDEISTGNAVLENDCLAVDVMDESDHIDAESDDFKCRVSECEESKLTVVSDKDCLKVDSVNAKNGDTNGESNEIQKNKLSTVSNKDCLEVDSCNAAMDGMDCENNGIEENQLSTDSFEECSKVDSASLECANSEVGNTVCLIASVEGSSAVDYVVNDNDCRCSSSGKEGQSSVESKDMKRVSMDVLTCETNQAEKMDVFEKFDDGTNNEVDKTGDVCLNHDEEDKVDRPIVPVGIRLDEASSDVGNVEVSVSEDPKENTPTDKNVTGQPSHKVIHLIDDDSNSQLTNENSDGKRNVFSDFKSGGELVKSRMQNKDVVILDSDDSEDLPEKSEKGNQCVSGRTADDGNAEEVAECSGKDMEHKGNDSILDCGEVDSNKPCTDSKKAEAGELSDTKDGRSEVIIESKIMIEPSKTAQLEVVEGSVVAGVVVLDTDMPTGTDMLENFGKDRDCTLSSPDIHETNSESDSQGCIGISMEQLSCISKCHENSLDEASSEEPSISKIGKDEKTGIPEITANCTGNDESPKNDAISNESVVDVNHSLGDIEQKTVQKYVASTEDVPAYEPMDSTDCISADTRSPTSPHHDCVPVESSMGPSDTSIPVDKSERSEEDMAESCNMELGENSGTDGMVDPMGVSDADDYSRNARKTHLVAMQNTDYNSMSPNLAVYNADNSLMCQQCGTSFETSEEFQDHVVGHLVQNSLTGETTDDDGWATCPVCLQMFPEVTMYEEHVKNHLTNTFSCKVCDKTFPERKALEEHVAKVHNIDRPFKCSECGKMFSSIAFLATHMRRIHDQEMAIKCDLCLFSCYQPEEMDRHTKRKHVNNSKKRSRSYTCEVCSRIYNSKNAFKKHLKIGHISTSDAKLSVEISGNSNDSFSLPDSSKVAPKVSAFESMSCLDSASAGERTSSVPVANDTVVDSKEATEISSSEIPEDEDGTPSKRRKSARVKTLESLVFHCGEHLCSRRFATELEYHNHLKDKHNAYINDYGEVIYIQARRRERKRKISCNSKQARVKKERREVSGDERESSESPITTSSIDDDADDPSFEPGNESSDDDIIDEGVTENGPLHKPLEKRPIVAFEGSTKSQPLKESVEKHPSTAVDVSTENQQLHQPVEKSPSSAIESHNKKLSVILGDITLPEKSFSFQIDPPKDKEMVARSSGAKMGQQSKDWSCFACPKSCFSSLWSLKLHLFKVHAHPNMQEHSGGYWLCPYCYSRCSSRAEFDKHIAYYHSLNELVDDSSKRLKHLSISTQESPYRCNICKKDFVTDRFLRMHKQREHAHARIFRCHVCHDEFEDLTGLLTHIRSIHNNQPPKQINPVPTKRVVERTVPPVIPSIPSTNSSNQANRQLAPIRRIFGCAVCEEVFNQENDLEKHIISVHRLAIAPNRHEKKPYGCFRCDKRFVQLNAITLHLVSYHKQDPNDIMGGQPKVVSDNESDNTNTDMQYQCLICLEYFPKKKYLDRHSQRNNCQPAKKQNKKAFVHDKNERPLDCPKCPGKYWGKAYLYLHIIETHGNIPLGEYLLKKRKKEAVKMAAAPYPVALYKAGEETPMRSRPLRGGFLPAGVTGHQMCSPVRPNSEKALATIAPKQTSAEPDVIDLTEDEPPMEEPIPKFSIIKKQTALNSLHQDGNPLVLVATSGAPNLRQNLSSETIVSPLTLHPGSVSTPAPKPLHRPNILSRSPPRSAPVSAATVTSAPITAYAVSVMKAPPPKIIPGEKIGSKINTLVDLTEDSDDDVVEIPVTTGENSTHSVIKCIHCADVFKEPLQMLIHVYSEHVKNNPFVCAFCSLKLMDKHTLQDHISTHEEFRKIKGMIRLKDGLAEKLPFVVW